MSNEIKKVGTWYTGQEIADRINTLLCAAQQIAENSDYVVEINGENIHDDLTIEIDGVVCIYPHEDVIEQADLTNTAGICQAYTVQTIQYDPGVRYYPDMSGQPPECDYQDTNTHENLDDAIIEAIMLVIESEICNFIEAEAEEKEAEEWQKSN